MSAHSVLNNSLNVKVVIDPEKVDAFIRSPEGPILRWMIVGATRVQDAARKQVRLGHIASGGRPNLRYTIVKRVIPNAHGGPMIRVGSDSPIAFIHHEGTKPHIIRPRTAKFLRFPANGGMGGGFVYAKVVHHPGTRPNRFLTDNMHLFYAAA